MEHVNARAGSKSNVEFPKEPVTSTEVVSKETVVQSKYSIDQNIVEFQIKKS